MKGRSVSGLPCKCYIISYIINNIDILMLIVYISFYDKQNKQYL
jgi:hypothetical protein